MDNLTQSQAAKLAQKIADITRCYVVRNKPPMISRWQLFHYKPTFEDRSWFTEGNGYTNRFYGFELPILGWSDDGEDYSKKIYEPTNG
jgi:hypothetical protein